METRVLTLFDFDDEDFLPKEAPKKKTPQKKETPAPAADNSTTDVEPATVPEITAEAEAIAITLPEEPVFPAEEQQVVTPDISPFTSGTDTNEERPAAVPETVATKDDAQLTEEEPLIAPADDTEVTLVTESMPGETPPVLEEEIVNKEEQAADEAEDTLVTENTAEEAPAGPEEETANKEEQAADDTEDTLTTENTAEEALAGPEEEIVNEEEQAADDELNRQIISELIQLDYTALIHKEYPFDVNKAQVIHKEKAAAPEQAPVEINEPDAEEETAVPSLPEWTLDKNYYTIGEVAQLFAVNTSHIRFWTNEFKLKPRTTRKGDRLYSPADIAELRLIHHLVKEKKHTIKGAREKLKAEKNGVNNKLDLKESLTGLRGMLIRIREQL